MLFLGEVGACKLNELSTDVPKCSFLWGVTEDLQILGRIKKHEKNNYFDFVMLKIRQVIHSDKVH